jgi:hypothetical protein
VPRAPLLPSLVKASNAGDNPTYAGAAAPEADGYAERLIKYIPGETIAFFLPFASITGISDGQLIAALAVAEILTLYWALDRNAKLRGDLRRPKVLVALWSLIAFPAWALGTSATTQHLLSWPALTCTLILAGTASLIPAFDELIAKVIVKQRAKE